MNVEHHKGTGIRAAKGQFVSPTLALKSSVQPNLAHAFAWENLTTHHVVVAVQCPPPPRAEDGSYT